MTRAGIKAVADWKFPMAVAALIAVLMGLLFWSIWVGMVVFGGAVITAAATIASLAAEKAVTTHKEKEPLLWEGQD
jgi:uncharacterized BrkB/YihY/UPF0761 family membrane protein